MANWIITSSVLILVIIFLRFILKGKISLRLQYGLWAIVLVRLLFPFSIGETVLSINNWLDSAADTKEAQQVVELTQTPLPSMTYNEAYDIVEEQYAEQGVDINHIPMEEFFETIEYEILDTMNDGYTPAEIIEMIWIVGMVLLSFGFIITNLHFLCKLKKSRVFLGTAGELIEACSLESTLSKKGNLLPVYQADVVETPCLYGIITPSIYVTKEAMAEKECLRHVLEHESTHYHHWDYLWSILRVICLALHWYNPLVWCAAILSRNDAELACDEATIERLGESERASYGRTLIGLTCEKRPAVLITATTMTGSGKSIKERIALIAKKPKMARITLVVVVVLAVVVVGVTYTGAKRPNDSVDHEVDTELADAEELDLSDTENDNQKKVEQSIYETTADLNHDGYDDLVKVMTKAVEGRAFQDVEQNGAYIKVFLGKENGSSNLRPVYTSELVTSSHGGNGTYVLTEKDGRDYLLHSLTYEQHGSAMYTYQVMCINEEGVMDIVESCDYQFIFSPWHKEWETFSHREDVVPVMKKDLEPWIENATILISFDIQTPTFISTKSVVIPAFTYYDLVWIRSDADAIEEYEESIGNAGNRK